MLVKQDGEWKLVSKSNPSKVLKNFGKTKPSEEAVAKEERRVQFFKHQNESKMKTFDEFINEESDEFDSITQVNKYIQKRWHPDLMLRKGRGYYYFDSKKNRKLANAIVGGPESVYVYNTVGTDKSFWDSYTLDILKHIKDEGIYTDKHIEKIK